MVVTHEIDQDGDVDLILPFSQNVAFQFESELNYPPTPVGLHFTRKGKESPIELDYGEMMETPREEIGVAEEGTEAAQEDTEASQEEAPYYPSKGGSSAKEEITPRDAVRIRVSSKHLALASGYFKRMLRSGMIESRRLEGDGHVDLQMEDSDPDAMLIIMNIIHGRFRQLPDSIDLDMVTKIAILVDFLDCLEIVEPFANRWINSLSASIPDSYSHQLIQWLCISWVFERATEFKAVTRTMIRKAKSPVETLGLPIPQDIVAEIDQRRCNSIDGLFSGLQQLLRDFRGDAIDCSFECQAMLYGALAKELDGRHLLEPSPRSPFIGYSYENAKGSIDRIREPVWADTHRRSRGWHNDYQQQECRLENHITPIVGSIADNLEGLSFSDHKRTTT